MKEILRNGSKVNGVIVYNPLAAQRKSEERQSANYRTKIDRTPKLLLFIEDHLNLGRPYVDHIKQSKFSNMKE
ncbi:MAG: hypothetical protein ABUK01_19105 [Leptospirales bacterium]